MGACHYILIGVDAGTTRNSRVSGAVEYRSEPGLGFLFVVTHSKQGIAW